MNNIKLYEPEHIYKDINTGEIYSPMSRVIDKFKSKFDSNYWAMRKAYQELVPQFPVIMKKYKDGDYKLFSELEKHISNKNVFEKYKQDYLARWKSKGDKSRKDGTAFHEEMEIKDIDRKYAINPIDNKPYLIYTNDTIDFNNLKPGCYLEIALSDPTTKIAGTPDKFFLVPDPTYSFLYVDMFDYKTNEVLFKTSYKKQKLLTPFNKYEETKINIYTFQLSGYQYMLSLLGAVPRTSELLYAPDKNEKRISRINLPILLKESERMFDLFSSH